MCACRSRVAASGDSKSTLNLARPLNLCNTVHGMARHGSCAAEPSQAEIQAMSLICNDSQSTCKVRKHRNVLMGHKVQCRNKPDPTYFLLPLGNHEQAQLLTPAHI